MLHTLKGSDVYLRALEPEDLEFIYLIENDESIWHISHTQTPYSRFLIEQYLENAQQDIYEAKQLRLAICVNETEEPIGLIDLFDFDPRNRRAGVGIVIRDIGNRGAGYGSQALGLLINYSFRWLHLHQLWANIANGNRASERLFAKFGFEQIGIKKDWNFIDGQYHDEAIVQLINIEKSR